MANTLTNLIPDLYEALDVVSREMVGFIPAVTLDSSVARASVNQTVRSIVAPASTAADISPGQLPPDTGDQNIGNETITIAKSRAVPFRWTGEEQRGLNSGPGYKTIRRDQIAQAMRTLVNEIEVYCGDFCIRTSRAYGTAGGTPFASDLSDPAQILKILKDNGAPQSDLQMVIDTTAGAKMRTLAQLTKANEAGTKELREQGILLDIHGFKIRESAGVKTNFTKGSITVAAAVTAAGSAGSVSVTITTGSGDAVALKAGDIIVFSGDTANKYVVASDCTIGASTTGVLTLAAPGLRNTISGSTITISNAGTRNMAFSRSAFVLATRMPALPEEGDMAEDRMTIVDPKSGMAFEIAMYKEYRRVKYEVSAAWGASLIKPAHAAVLLG